MLEELPDLFSRKRERSQAEAEELQAELYRQIGQLKVELDWVKKSRSCSLEERRSWIDRNHPRISITRQCDLLGLSRSDWYYQPTGETAFNVWLMN